MDSYYKKVYTKAEILYVGELYNEMYDKNLMIDLKYQSVSNSSSLNAGLSLNPKVIVLRCLSNSSSNNFILQTIINTCPKAKILVIGGVISDFKKTIRGFIHGFLDDDSNFEGLKTALDEISFVKNYNENFNSVEMDLRIENEKAHNLVLISLALCIGAGIVSMFIFLNFI